MSLFSVKTYPSTRVSSPKPQEQGIHRGYDTPLPSGAYSPVFHRDQEIKNNLHWATTVTGAPRALQEQSRTTNQSGSGHYSGAESSGNGSSSGRERMGAESRAKRTGHAAAEPANSWEGRAGGLLWGCRCRAGGTQGTAAQPHGRREFC